MARIESNHYYEYDGTSFTIKDKNHRWHLDFTFNEKRIKRSTWISATTANLIVVKTEIIPQIMEELTGKFSVINDEGVNSTDVILEEFAENHFAIHMNNVREHVFKRDLANFNNHILPYFKGRKLSSIKPMELEAWQNRLMTKYKSSSAQKYRSIFYSIFTRAFKNDLLDKNPLDKVTAPKVKKRFDTLEEDDNINPFTKAEIDILVNDEDDTSYMPNIIKFMASTGMRPGEIIALTKKDIDFEKRTINVNKSVMKGKVGLPKTRSSVRVIDMLDGAYEALKSQLKKNKFKDCEYVFTNQYGKPFRTHDIININLKKRLKKHGIEIRPLYQLRHSFASRMIKSGVDITWVSKTLGHQDVSITLKIYTKYIQEDEKTRLENLNKINKLVA